MRLSTTGARGTDVATDDDGSERVLEVMIEYRVDERIDAGRQVAEPRERNEHRLRDVTTSTITAECGGHATVRRVRGGFLNQFKRGRRRLGRRCRR